VRNYWLHLGAAIAVVLFGIILGKTAKACLLTTCCGKPLDKPKKKKKQ
jgi:hypothetical protein